jgi:hypothetical protein
MPNLNVSRVTFTANDPVYGVFVAGDIVDTYFDTTYLTYSVKRNGVDYPQSGASSIHTSQRELNTGQLYYRSIQLLIPEYCIGTDLYTFSNKPTAVDTSGGYSDWPYCAHTVTANSNQCAAAPVYQDLAWSGTPTIVHSTTPASQDGSITYTATSSYGPIYYTLKGDWSEQNTTGQFLYLTPGQYLLQARDNKGFIIAYGFQIIDLSAGLRPPPIAVCDLIFPGFPTIVQDSGAGDGSITFTATSSKAILYALRDFFYYDGTGQASSTFSSLRAGNYVLYAVDANNCKANYSFTIPLATAPSTPAATPPTNGIVYQMQMPDYCGNISVINVVKLSYTGAVTQVDGGSASPIVHSIRLEGSTDPYPTVSSQQLSITFKSTPFQFLSLFTNSEDYRVYYYKNRSLNLACKIYPQSYKEAYTESVNYPVTFEASDGLAELDDIDFLDSTGARYSGTQKQIRVIASILAKLGFNLNIRSACNIFATGMSTGAANDPLDQAYVDCQAYYPKNKALSCIDVIDRILAPYCATLVQWAGYWWIIRYEELVTTSVAYREYDPTGAYVTNGTFNPQVAVKKATDYNALHWIDGAFLDMTPAYGDVKLVYKQGLLKSILRNGEFNIVETKGIGFDLKKSIDLSGFTMINNSDITNTQFTWVDEELTNSAIIIQGTGLAYMTTTIPGFKMGGLDRLNIMVKYKIEDTVIGYPYQKVRMVVKLGSYYMLADGSWSNSATATVLTKYETSGSSFNEFKASSVTAPTGGIYTGDLTISIYTSYVLNADYTSVVTMKTKQTAGLPTGYRTEAYDSGSMLYYELENNTSESYYGNTIFTGDLLLIPTLITSKDIIRPNDYNSSTNPYQWVLKKQINPALNTPVVGQLTIDEIKVNYSPGGAELAEDQILTCSPSTTKKVFTKTIYHGSAVDSVKTIFANSFSWSSGPATLSELYVANPNSTKTHLNFLRNSSGASWSTWKRNAVNESKPLQEITMLSYAAQIKDPSRRISGSLSAIPVAGSAVSLSPISVIKDYYDGKLYRPIYTYRDRECLYEGEFIELKDITAGATSTGGGVRTFNKTFNSTFK